MSIIRQGFESADLDVPVVLPTLNLDFANSQSLDKRITFSRGSIGTRVNRNGLIETIPANQPRFDFDPITGQSLGLLIEEPRTNLLLQSEDLSTTWSNTGTTEILNATTAPDGTNTADQIVENTSYGQHYMSSNAISWASNTTYTCSVFAKAENRKFLDIAFGTSSFWVNGHRRAVFNLSNGTVHSTAGSSLTALISPYPNGWYRCSITATTISGAVAPTTCQFLITFDGTSGGSYSGNGTSGLYLWGAQLEQGAFPTSYIPTTASIVPRSADNAFMTGTNFSSWYNQTEGSIYCSYNIQQNIDTITRLIFRFDDLTTNNRIGYYDRTSNNPQFRFEYIDGRVLSTGLPDWKIQNNKIACSITSQNSKFSTNGVITNLNTIKTIPALSRAFIGNDSNVTSYLNGTIAKFTYYPKALSPAELQYLTQ
jgi:hypothetical protein